MLGACPSSPSICVFCGSNAGAEPAYVEAAEAVGRGLAQRGVRRRLRRRQRRDDGRAGRRGASRRAARSSASSRGDLRPRDRPHRARRPARRRLDARAQGADGRALRRVHRAARRRRHARGAVRGLHLGAARHPPEAARAPGRRRLLPAARRLPRPRRARALPAPVDALAARRQRGPRRPARRVRGLAAAHRGTSGWTSTRRDRGLRRPQRRAGPAPGGRRALRRASSPACPSATSTSPAPAPADWPAGCSPSTRRRRARPATRGASLSELPEFEPVDHAQAAAFTAGAIGRAHALAAASDGAVAVVTDVAGLDRCRADGTLAMVLHLEGAEAIDPGPRGARRLACRRRTLDRPRLEPAQRLRPRRAVPLPRLARHRAGPHRRRARAGPPLRAARHPRRPEPPQRGRLRRRRAHRRRADRRLASRVPRALRRRRATSPTTSCARSAPAAASSGSSSPRLPARRRRRRRRHAALNARRPRAPRRRASPAIDHVGLGSDFDGAPMPAALADVAALPRLLDALRDDGFSADEVAAHRVGQLAARARRRPGSRARRPTRRAGCRTRRCRPRPRARRRAGAACPRA